MKYYRIIGIVCVWIFFIGQICAQYVSDNECLRLVESNDSDDVLKEMVIYPPVFCAMHDGKRLKMKISNEGEKVMRKTCFYLFYKKKRICRIHLPNMKKGEKIPVWVYTSGDSVELFFNGKSLGRKSKGAPGYA